MARSSRPTRTPAQLSDTINGHLNRYGLAAGAAGVGMLALAPPVQAKIIYTPADVNFSRYPPVSLDLNHDGIGDFVLALGGAQTVPMSRHTDSFMLPAPAPRTESSQPPRKILNRPLRSAPDHESAPAGYSATQTF